MALISKKNDFVGNSFARTLRRACLAVGLFSAGVACSQWIVATAEAEPAHRYPYDPVCAWGRVADGNGMLVRCLVQAEATTLAGPELEAKPAAKQKDVKAAPTVVAPPEEKAEPPKEITAEMGELSVDTGTLPHATKKLGTAKDRFVKCIEQNGGMSKATGDVQLRFLVRERGRAEGVSVQKRQGISREAGRCIAKVVDRRYVGYPAAPIVGATLTIKFSAK